MMMMRMRMMLMRMIFNPYYHVEIGARTVPLLIRHYSGCGASCVYGLLGAQLYNWQFTVTEIDAYSADFARKNIAANQMQERITLV